MRKGLEEMEYEILEPLSLVCGVPTSIIIGKDESKGLNHKADFGKLLPTGLEYLFIQERRIM